MPIRRKRIYDPPHPDDGYRLLVDRLWPRGLSKEAALVDEWNRDLAPSTELRRWFHADRDRWEEFRTRFRAELSTRSGVLEDLAARVRKGCVTLLFASKDSERNHAVLIEDALREFGGAT